MKLVCYAGSVLAWYADDQAIPPDAYPPGIAVVAYSGNLDALGRVGPEPAAGLPDTRPYAAPPIDLAAIKTGLKLAVDQAAEQARLPWITPGVGQSMEYDKVEQQADAALKAPSTATAAKYPMLSVTVGIDIDPETGEAATDVLGVARSVVAARDAWITAGAKIRGTRLKTKAAIDAADTIEAAVAAAGTASWPAAPGA